MTIHENEFGVNKVTMTSEEFLRNTSTYQCNFGEGTKNYYVVDDQSVEVEIVNNSTSLSTFEVLFTPVISEPFL